MRTNTRWRIKGTLTTRTPMHIGDGTTFDKQLHRKVEEAATCEVQAVVKDYRGQPCIPGTSLKGVLRSWATANKVSQNSINKIFGPENCDHSGWVEFCTATLASKSSGSNVPYWNPDSGTGILSHVAIDRFHGAAEEMKLFFEEYVPEGTVFKVCMQAATITEAEVAVLLGILKHGTNPEQMFPIQFGANGADGWGRMEWKLNQVETYNYATDQYTRKNVSPVLLESGDAEGWDIFNLTLKSNGPLLVNDTSKTHSKPDDDKPHFVALRRTSGDIWLPASSFRGVLRSHFEFLAKSKYPSADLAKEVFGDTGQIAHIHLDEFTQASGNRDLQHQDFVAIDRFTGGAADTAKFHANYADRPEFKTRLKLRLDKFSEAAKKILAATLHDLCLGKLSFGFGGSRGYGELVGTLDKNGQAWLKKILGEASEQSKIPEKVGPALEKGFIDITPNKNPTANPVKTLRGKSVKSIFNLLSLDLRDYHTLGSIEIEFELENDQPVRIRFAGKDYIPAGSAAAAATATTTTPQVRGDVFAHPYYFLAASDREKFTGDLADSKPVGHDQYKPGTYSGKLRVKLKTATPLLICDDSRATEDATQHKTYPVLERDSKPLLASSSVRGMLRGAYEAITNSRFGVFPIDSDKGHQNRLAYRRQAKVDVEPVYVELATPDRVVLKVLSQLWQNSPAKLPRYQQRSNQRDKGEAQAALRYSDRALPAHGDRVYVQVADNGRITAIERYQAASPGPGWQQGYVLLTGANINSKQCERVFVLSPTDKTLTLEGEKARELHSLWTELITNYQNEHERDLKKRLAQRLSPTDYLGPEPGKTAWSRHVIDPAMKTLQAGMCVYIKRTPQRITDIFPVSISRKLYERSPLQATPPKLLPARNINELSPADRVFGWVSQDPKTGKDPSYRSHVRIGPVTCQTEKAIERVRKTLAILGQPKPAQGRFYLGKPDGTAQPNGGTKEQRGYTGTNRIRGPKVYPHHAAGFDEKTAYAKPEKSQNRTVEGYVKPDTVFEFDLHFTNLTALELGGLLWLLTLPEEHYLRLGLGKPLGFGSVAASIDWQQSQLALGEDWINAVGTANPPPCRNDWGQLKKNFAEMMQNSNPLLLKGFLAACKGWKDLATHYPRTQQQQPGSGESYKWFVENDRTGQDGGPGLSLPDLTNSQPSLPYLPEKN